MLPQVPDLRTDGKNTDQIVTELVKFVNVLNKQLQLAFSSLDMSSVTAMADGTTLEDLFEAGALKGYQGIQGNPGKVYRPSVTAEGEISWTLTDEGGTTPSPQNIKGATGETGATGATGPGVPAGGTTGQILRKKSDSDYDTEWVTP